MFLISDSLNESKAVVISAKNRISGHSEGKNPKSCKMSKSVSGWDSNKSQACVNSNWQKLRG